MENWKNINREDMIIYGCKNIINNKWYIGKTIKTLNCRKKQHIGDVRRNSILHFHKAIRKHGYDNFEWLILYNANKPEELEEKEKYFIILYDSFNNGYNMTTGGEGHYEFLEESIERMKKAQKGHFTSEETKKKISESHKGKKLSEETKKKLSQQRIGNKSHTGIPCPEDIKAKISNTLKGRQSPVKSMKFTRTQEFKNKISEANRRRVITKEMINNFSKAQKNSVKTQNRKRDKNGRYI